MSIILAILLIAVIVAVASSIPGVFLVLRKMSMMSDAITHTVLLGIVVMFFVTDSLNSPLLIIGAILTGLITVFMVELLVSTNRVSEDSAIGVVFPLLFGTAVILISKYAGNVHLDVDSVLLGEIAFAPLNKLYINGESFGPKAIYTMGTVLVINVVLVIVFFKELKIATFDSELSKSIGINPKFLYYGLMLSVSLTAVGAFEAVGSILVIAFMIGPAATSYLLTDNLKKMLFISAIIGSIDAVIGVFVALVLDVSISGTIAVIIGLMFALVFVFAPKRGMLTTLKRRIYQKQEFAEKSLLFHVMNHEHSDYEFKENGVTTIYQHLNWSNKYLDKIINKLLEKKHIEIDDNVYKLTDNGRQFTILSYEEIIESF